MTKSTKPKTNEPLSEKDFTKQQAVNVLGSMLYAIGVDVPAEVLKRQKKSELASVLNAVSSLVSRRQFASALGQSFDGKRDNYLEFGWKKELTFDDYANMYERNGIASACVDILADECWREGFVVHDGKKGQIKQDYFDNTEFLKAWSDLVESQNIFEIFNDLHKALGISRYALIFIGMKGATDYRKPLEDGGKIEFLRVLNEGQATPLSFITTVTDPRYGLPEFYSCTFDEENATATQVHWTRCLAFKRGIPKSRFYGTPDLQNGYNYLQDLEKVVGSSSEAFWQQIKRRVVLAAAENANFPQEGTPGYEKFQEAVERFEHKMSEILKVGNVKVSELGSTIVHGREQTSLLIELIAGTYRIPQRRLLGSERGELASSQDRDNLDDTVTAIQKTDCNGWAKGFIKYCIDTKILPAPQTSKFFIEWNPLREMSEMEKAELWDKKLTVIEKATGGNIEDAILVEDIVKDLHHGYVAPTARVRKEEIEVEDEVA